MDIQPQPVRVSVRYEELQHVFAKYGFAMHQVQGIEQEMGNLLFASRFNRGHMNGPAVKRLIAGLPKRTVMGKQFETVLREARLDRDVIRRLNRALQTRNRLAHRFFVDHELVSRTQIQAALDELTEIADEFAILLNRLYPISDDLLTKKGIPTDEISKQIDRALGELETR
jgi:hypothetical protein